MNNINFNVSNYNKLSFSKIVIIFSVRDQLVQRYDKIHRSNKNKLKIAK